MLSNDSKSGKADKYSGTGVSRIWPLVLKTFLFSPKLEWLVDKHILESG